MAGAGSNGTPYRGDGSPVTYTAGLEQTVLPSPQVTNLDPGRRDVYADRLADAAGSAADHYQVNSRLRPWELADLPSAQEVRAVQEWFLRSGRSYDPDQLRSGVDAPLRPLSGLPAPFAALLGRFGPDGPMAPSLYPADLVVVDDDELALMPPNGPALVVERRPGPGVRTALAGAVPEAQRAVVTQAPWLLAVVTVPWRHMVLYGERGYRRALMETGVLVTNTCGIALECGLRPVPMLDFADTVVDRVLDNDGVERFCAALIALSPRSPNGDRPQGGKP